MMNNSDTLFESDEKFFCFDSNFSANLENSYDYNFNENCNHQIAESSPSASSSSSSSTTTTTILSNISHSYPITKNNEITNLMQDSTIESIQKQFDWLKLQALNTNLDSSSFPKIICSFCHECYNEKFTLTTGFEHYLSSYEAQILSQDSNINTLVLLTQFLNQHENSTEHKEALNIITSTNTQVYSTLQTIDCTAQVQYNYSCEQQLNDHQNLQEFPYKSEEISYIQNSSQYITSEFNSNCMNNSTNTTCENTSGEHENHLSHRSSNSSEHSSIIFQNNSNLIRKSSNGDVKKESSYSSSSSSASSSILKAINKRKLHISCPICASKVVNMSDHLVKKHNIKDRNQRKCLMDSVRRNYLITSNNYKSEQLYNQLDHLAHDKEDADASDETILCYTSSKKPRKLTRCPICVDNKYFVNISDHLIKIHHLNTSEMRKPVLKSLKSSMKSSNYSKNRAKEARKMEFSANCDQQSQLNDNMNTNCNKDNYKGGLIKNDASDDCNRLIDVNDDMALIDGYNVVMRNDDAFLRSASEQSSEFYLNEPHENTIFNLNLNPLATIEQQQSSNCIENTSSEEELARYNNTEADCAGANFSNASENLARNSCDYNIIKRIQVVEENQNNSMQLMSALQKQIDSFTSQVNNLEKLMSVLMREDNSNGNNFISNSSRNIELQENVPQRVTDDYITSSHELNCSYTEAAPSFDDHQNTDALFEFSSTNAHSNSINSINHHHLPEHENNASHANDAPSFTNDAFMVNP